MNTELIPGLIGIVFVVWIVYLIATRDKRAIKKVTKREARKNALTNKLNSKDIILSGKHITGLPIAEGIQCIISYLSDKIEIKQGGNTFNLDLSKVTDITSTTDTEIQKHYVSSVGGAVGGAVLFGPLGAMVGGRAKEKKTTTVTHYLVITYNSDGEIKYISFEYLPSASSIDFVTRFNLTKNNTTNNVVNL